MPDPTITIRKGRFIIPCQTTYKNYSIRIDTEKKIDITHLMQVLENKYRNKRILRDFFLPQKSEYGATYSVWTDRVAEKQKANRPFGTAEYEFDSIDSVQVLPSPQQIKELVFKKGKEEKQHDETSVTIPEGCDLCSANPFTIKHASLKWYNPDPTVPPGLQNIAATFFVSFKVHYKYKQQVKSQRDPTPALHPTSLVLWSPTITNAEAINVSSYIASTAQPMIRRVETTSDQCECYQ